MLQRSDLQWLPGEARTSFFCLTVIQSRMRKSGDTPKMSWNQAGEEGCTVGPADAADTKCEEEAIDVQTDDQDTKKSSDVFL